MLDPIEPYEAKAMGITPHGELIVDTWEGRKLVSSGEVSVRGVYGYVCERRSSALRSERLEYKILSESGF